MSEVSSPIRVVMVVEASSITGVAKPLFEFAREAAVARTELPAVDLSFATFLRGERENAFTRAVLERGIPLDTIEESRRFDVRVVRGLRDLVARRRPHFVWTNASKSHFLARLSGLHRRAVWIAYHHGYTFVDRTQRFYNQLDRWSLRAASRVVTVCRPFADELQRRGVPAERLRIQHTPIRPSPPPDEREVAELRAKLGIGEATRVLLTVGRLSSEKGHADLVRAVARGRWPRLKLLIAGSGVESGRLAALASELGVSDRVLLLGHQDRVRELYALADVFVLPSYSEGSPNVLLEAMDARVPVVATAVGGLPEVATGERDALLVPPGDVASLSAAVDRLLSDEALRERLRTGGREVVARQSPQSYYENLVRIMTEVRRGAG